jgi:hypothetical protein
MNKTLAVTRRSRLLLLLAMVGLALPVTPLASQNAHAITYGEEILDAKFSKPWVLSVWQYDADEDHY